MAYSSAAGCFSHRLQGPTFKVMGYMDSLMEPNLPSLSPPLSPTSPPVCPTCGPGPGRPAELHTSVTSAAVGTQGWLGCSPHQRPWGSLLCPARAVAPSTSPACLSPTSSGVSAGSCRHSDACALSHPGARCLPDYSVQPGHTPAGWERWDKARSV